MEYIPLNKIAIEYSLTIDECYKAILNHSNNIGIKLLSKVGAETMCYMGVLNAIQNTIQELNNSLTSYEYISQNAAKHIPLERDGHIYYLFNNKQLIYIGQSIILPARIGTHMSNGIEFDSMYCEKVDRDFLLTKERLYIHRDMPFLNVAVLDNYEYICTILSISDIIFDQ